MLPVLTPTEFVATIPVPASPSGGQTAMPALSVPVGSSFLAPSSVSFPADAPAGSDFGMMSLIFHPRFFGAISSSN